jgi:hypothetical protein
MNEGLKTLTSGDGSNVLKRRDDQHVETLGELKSTRSFADEDPGCV